MMLVCLAVVSLAAAAAGQDSAMGAASGTSRRCLTLYSCFSLVADAKKLDTVSLNDVLALKSRNPTSPSAGLSQSVHRPQELLLLLRRSPTLCRIRRCVQEILQETQVSEKKEVVESAIGQFLPQPP